METKQLPQLSFADKITIAVMGVITVTFIFLIVLALFFMLFD